MVSEKTTLEKTTFANEASPLKVALTKKTFLLKMDSIKSRFSANVA